MSVASRPMPAADPVRVGFVLLSSPERPIPSTRIAALNVFPLLQRAGYRPELLHAPVEPSERPALNLSAAAVAASGVRIVVFQKVHGPDAENLARALERHGVRTVFLVCDIVDPGMCAATSATVVVTPFLRSLYPAELRHRVHVVHDGIERPDVLASVGNARAGLVSPLRAVLVTSSELIELPVLGDPPPWLQVTVVGAYAEDGARVQRLRRGSWALQRASGGDRLRLLRALVHPRIRRVRWSPERVYEELARAQVGIIPIDTAATERGPLQPVPVWQIKSENRLTLKMAAGLPVVATPIPAYRDVLQHGRNGFFATTRQEWLSTLRQLRDGAVRQRIGQAARDSVVDRYSQREQAAALCGVFDALLVSAGATATRD